MVIPHSKCDLLPRQNQDLNARSTKPQAQHLKGLLVPWGEDDVAVCPNCEWELGTGEGKRQEIWVSKACGHVSYRLLSDTKSAHANIAQVYCGECAENRSMSKAKKAQAPQRTKPFAKCQVDGCGKSVSAPTAMVHLYLMILSRTLSSTHLHDVGVFWMALAFFLSSIPNRHGHSRRYINFISLYVCSWDEPS